ncbi:MAG: OmpH family outer membrane protein [Bacteroidota bacterium]|jgi:outer membrane protein|nr:OmpH family outer membrane protein [Bacteroidota bacterium]MCA6443376.1 OmpH family outer membrane protein [Bacteroidota bacterium]
MVKNFAIVLSLIIGVSALVISLTNMQTKLVFVDMNALYSEFALSKELNKNLETVIKSRKKIVDSLYNVLQDKTFEMKTKNITSKEAIEYMAKLEQEFYYKEQDFEKQNQESNREYNIKIWNQLNQYVEDYGKENKCTFVYGANGQGSIMFADEKNNHTKLIIQYVNDRYNGIIKK